MMSYTSQTENTPASTGSSTKRLVLAGLGLALLAGMIVYGTRGSWAAGKSDGSTTPLNVSPPSKEEQPGEIKGGDVIGKKSEFKGLQEGQAVAPSGVAEPRFGRIRSFFSGLRTSRRAQLIIGAVLLLAGIAVYFAVTQLSPPPQPLPEPAAVVTPAIEMYSPTIIWKAIGLFLLGAGIGLVFLPRILSLVKLDKGQGWKAIGLSLVSWAVVSVSPLGLLLGSTFSFVLFTPLLTGLLIANTIAWFLLYLVPLAVQWYTNAAPDENKLIISLRTLVYIFSVGLSSFIGGTQGVLLASLYTTIFLRFQVEKDAMKFGKEWRGILAFVGMLVLGLCAVPAAVGVGWWVLAPFLGAGTATIALYAALKGIPPNVGDTIPLKWITDGIDRGWGLVEGRITQGVKAGWDKIKSWRG